VRALEEEAHLTLLDVALLGFCTVMALPVVQVKEK
jgi:hypothetical protein